MLLITEQLSHGLFFAVSLKLGKCNLLTQISSGCCYFIDPDRTIGLAGLSNYE